MSDKPQKTKPDLGETAVPNQPPDKPVATTDGTKVKSPSKDAEACQKKKKTVQLGDFQTAEETRPWRHG